jgi:hypothetical protein
MGCRLTRKPANFLNLKFFKMIKYKAKVKHDKGNAVIYVYANNEQDARKEICRLEGCPDSAIVKLEKLPIYVTMTDKFFSGWGMAANKTNKFIVVCDSWKDAETIERNAKKRSEMKYINICIKCKCYRFKYRYFLQ